MKTIITFLLIITLLLSITILSHQNKQLKNKLSWTKKVLINMTNEKIKYHKAWYKAEMAQARAMGSNVDLEGWSPEPPK